jgi:predicted CXXCH cytochrome family protein
MEDKWAVLVVLLVLLIGCSNTAARKTEPVPGPPAGQNAPGANCCIKCHEKKYAYWVKSAHARLGRNVINPQLDHGLFSSAGFEDKTHQLSCLDCHDVHSDHDHLLESSQSNLCFKCHESAIVTMGMFQPVNYLAGGKL